MTLEERIEAAARALFEKLFRSAERLDGNHIWSQADERIKDGMRAEARVVGEAFAPELFSSPPTHWIAPWKATEEMVEAFAEKQATYPTWANDTYAREGFKAARDAYLNREGE